MNENPDNLRIGSGGQTGVDRAALDAATELGVKVEVEVEVGVKCRWLVF